MLKDSCAQNTFSSAGSPFAQGGAAALPTLQELIDAADWHVLSRMVRKQAFGPGWVEGFGMRRVLAVEDRVCEVLEEMCSITAAPPSDGPWFLAGREVFGVEEDGETINRTVEACRIRLGEGQGAEVVFNSCFAQVAWEEVLGYPVWVAPRFCNQEEYLLLASAFWEMTRFGFSAAAAQNRARGHGAYGTAAPVWVAPASEAGRRSTWEDSAALQQGYRESLESCVEELNRQARQAFVEEVRRFALSVAH